MLKNVDDEIDKYKTLNKTLATMSHNLEKISQEKSKLYGADYLSKIDDEIEAIDKEITAQKALQTAANENIRAEKLNLFE
jgi:peptidoglycan hydrolase CwlO-like protein